jgi:hypothetical protein
MNRLLSLLCVELLLIPSAFAQDATLPSTERIAQSLALEGIFEAARADQLAAMKGQVMSLIAILRNRGTPEPLLTALQPRAESAMASAINSWSPKEASHIFLDGLKSALTDDDLARADAFYQTPQGRKIYAALLASQKKASEYISAKYRETYEREMKALMDQVDEEVARAAKGRSP